VEVDLAQIDKAHWLNNEKGLDASDDAVTMQYLIPDWKVDDKHTLDCSAEYSLVPYIANTMGNGATLRGNMLYMFYFCDKATIW